MFQDHTTLFGNKTTATWHITWVQDTAVAESLYIIHDLSEVSN